MIQGIIYQVVVGMIAGVQCTSHNFHRKMQGNYQVQLAKLLGCSIPRTVLKGRCSPSSNYRWHNRLGAARRTQAGHKNTGYLPNKILAILVPHSAPHTTPTWRCGAFIKQQPMGWVPKSVLTKGSTLAGHAGGNTGNRAQHAVTILSLHITM